MDTIISTSGQRLSGYNNWNPSSSINTNIGRLDSTYDVNIGTFETKSIVDSIIEKLTGEGTLDIVLETLMNKVSEYMESEDNKELLSDFINHKLNFVIANIKDEMSELRIKIDKLNEELYKLKEHIGITRNGYDNNYYLGSISTRLNELERKTNRVDGLWNNYLGQIESLVSNKSNK